MDGAALLVHAPAGTSKTPATSDGIILPHLELFVDPGRDLGGRFGGRERKNNQRWCAGNRLYTLRSLQIFSTYSKRATKAGRNALGELKTRSLPMLFSVCEAKPFHQILVPNFTRGAVIIWRRFRNLSP